MSCRREARHIEDLRRGLLDRLRGYGFELVMPPLLEHIESLLSGTGHALDLQTFKLVDQLSGRTLGLRADSTPQVARIDAHLLNRNGVARLCYCGPVLHTRPTGAGATREPLQFGAEIYGHAGLDADLEILRPDARVPAASPRSSDVVVDLADARIVRAVLAGVPVDAARARRGLRRAGGEGRGRARARSAPASRRRRGSGLEALLGLYGDDAVLDEAERALPGRAGIARGARRPAPARRERAPRPSARARSASTSPTRAATPTTAARASPPTRAARATRSRAAAATTRSARSSAATGPPSASAST